VWIAIYMFVVFGGMCGLPYTCMWCLEGCVDSHGCTMGVL